MHNWLLHLTRRPVESPQTGESAGALLPLARSPEKPVSRDWLPTSFAAIPVGLSFCSSRFR